MQVGRGGGGGGSRSFGRVKESHDTWTTKLQSSFVRNLFRDIVKTIYPTTDCADKAPGSAIVIREICKLFHLTTWNLAHATETPADCPPPLERRFRENLRAVPSILQLSSKKERKEENNSVANFFDFFLTLVTGSRTITSDQTVYNNSSFLFIGISLDRNYWEVINLLFVSPGLY